MRRLALVVEYEGTHYHGFQLQANAPTVQEELEKALHQLTGVHTRVQGAGRTDSGAHALGQVVAFSTGSPVSVGTFVTGLNAYLPQDIAIHAAYQVETGFDPRRDAISRLYRYTILNRAVRSPAWEQWAYRVAASLDVAVMGIALRSLKGTRDFAAFAAPVSNGKSSVRRLLNTRVWQEEDRVLVEMEANAFLTGQVRRTVAALVRVGKGNLLPEALRAMADGRSHSVPIASAPSKGLCLMQVNY